MADGLLSQHSREVLAKAKKITVPISLQADGRSAESKAANPKEGERKIIGGRPFQYTQGRWNPVDIQAEIMDAVGIPKGITQHTRDVLTTAGKSITEAPKYNILETAKANLRKDVLRPLVTPEMVQKLPSPLRPLGMAAREFTSPAQLAILGATAGLGPTLAAGIKGGTGAVGVVRGIVAGAVSPVVKGGFAARLGGEAAMGTGAVLAAQETAKRTQNLPTPLRVGLPLVAGAVGGMGTLAAGRAVAPTAKAIGQGAKTYAKTAIETGGVPAGILPPKVVTAARAAKLSAESKPQRIARFTVPQLEAQRVALDAQLEKSGFAMDAIGGLSPDEYFIVVQPPKLGKYQAYRGYGDDVTKPLIDMGASGEAVDKITKTLEQVAKSGEGTGFLYFQNMDDVSKFFTTGEYKAPSIISRVNPNAKSIYELGPQPKPVGTFPKTRPIHGKGPSPELMQKLTEQPEQPGQGSLVQWAKNIVKREDDYKNFVQTKIPRTHAYGSTQYTTRPSQPVASELALAKSILTRAEVAPTIKPKVVRLPKKPITAGQAKMPVEAEAVPVGMRTTAFEQGVSPQTPQEWYRWARGAKATDELASGNKATWAPRLKPKDRIAVSKIIRDTEKTHPEWKTEYETQIAENVAMAQGMKGRQAEAFARSEPIAAEAVAPKITGAGKATSALPDTQMAAQKVRPPVTEVAAERGVPPTPLAASKAPVGDAKALTPTKVTKQVATTPLPTGASSTEQYLKGYRAQQGTAAKLRLSIRDTKTQGGGFLISGRDTRGRQVRVFAKSLQEAKQARENIRQGLEPLVGTEAEAAARAVTKAERKYKVALKRGEAGVTERARTELEQAQTRPVQPPPPVEPPPPKVMPDGSKVPYPEFEAARNKLVTILKGSARKTSKEIEAARTTERARRFAISRASTEKALAEGKSPLPGIRSAQKGKMPVSELELADRITPDEFAVLRDKIYKTLGPELDWTSANTEEALSNLAFYGKVPTDSELAWLGEIYGTELVESLRALRPKSAKIIEGILEAWNLPRAILASFDDSMVLRQGLHLLPEGKPAGVALKAHIKALTKAGSVKINEVIRENPWYNHARAHGLDLTLPGLRPGISGHEEVFFGARVAQKIPILGKGIEISERIATAYLNKLRIETYSAHAAELQRMGAGYNAFKELAENINILSGRASLGRTQAMAPVLNGMFFSARLNWARAQTPFRILRQVPNLNTPEGRHLAGMLAKDVYGMWAGIAGMLGVAAAAGAVVELDPRSSDFGKMQIGTVRIDPWAGQQQFAVLMARIISGQTKTTTTGQVMPADAVNVLGRFIESKAHPALGQLIAVKEGKTYVGEDMTVKQYAKQWLPLMIQDIQDLVAGTTPAMAGAIGTAAFFGVSTYNIPGVPSSVTKQFQDALDSYNAIPATAAEAKAKGYQSREAYREAHPDVDAKLFIAGVVTSLKTDNAKKIAVQLMKQNGIKVEDILPPKGNESLELQRLRLDLVSALEGKTGTPTTSTTTPVPSTRYKKMLPVRKVPAGVP